MSDTQKPVDIALVRQTLRDEGCPGEVVSELVQYFESHPGTKPGDLIRHLGELARNYGHVCYLDFKKAGFRRHQIDPLLVSWV